MSKRKHNKSFLLSGFRGVVHTESENPFQRAVMSDVVFAGFRQRLLRQRFRVFAAAKRESELKHIRYVTARLSLRVQGIQWLALS